MINKVGSATQSSPVAAAGTPNLWSINNITTPPPHHHSFLVAPPPPHDHHLTPWDHTLDHPWMSQLLLGGVVNGNGKPGLRESQVKKMENNLTSDQVHIDSWSHQIQQMSAASSPKSCITNLDFSPKSSDLKHPSSECNDSTTAGGATKKARIQASLPHSTFKVRKEKLGDRITALHQIVSPFGKTDTASVLLEAIGYIRFLHTQIEALSLPYMDSGSKATRQNPDESKEKPRADLRSRGLCLVPIACTLEVDSDINGADYWASAFGPNLG